MTDRFSKFDHTKFDKSAAYVQTGLTISLQSTGEFSLNFIVVYPFNTQAISGYTIMETGLTPLVNSSIAAESSGELSIGPIVLKRALTIPFIGAGDLLYSGVNARTPLILEDIEGSGDFYSDKEYVNQQIVNEVSGNMGVLSSDIILRKAMEETPDIVGSSIFTGLLSMKRAINVDLLGTTDLYIRVSNLDESIFTVMDVNIEPGETIIIDTDLLSVYLNGAEDVSSVTVDSEFFELDPGSNEIMFTTEDSSPGNNSMEVKTVWQNRWL